MKIFVHTMMKICGTLSQDPQRFYMLDKVIGMNVYSLTNYQIIIMAYRSTFLKTDYITGYFSILFILLDFF